MVWLFGMACKYGLLFLPSKTILCLYALCKSALDRTSGPIPIPIVMTIGEFIMIQLFWCKISLMQNGNKRNSNYRLIDVDSILLYILVIKHLLNLKCSSQKYKRSTYYKDRSITSAELVLLLSQKILSFC